VYRLTDAKFSDIDGKTYKKDQCYHVQIRNLAENVELVFDMATAQKTETIDNCMKLALQNGCKWETPTWMKKKEKA